MSSIMQNITDGLSQAGQVLSKSGKKAAAGVQTAAELAKLNWKLDEAKKAKEAAYAALGKAYYEAHESENGTEFESDIVAIRRAQLEIDRLEAKIADCHTPKDDARAYTSVEPAQAAAEAPEKSSEEKTAEEVAAQAAESEEAAKAVEAAEKDEETGSDL